MFIGAVELSQVITVDRRVTQVASSTADLVARAEKQISHTEIGDIMKVGGYIMEPYSQNPLEITLRNVTSSPANATTTKSPGRAPTRARIKPKPASAPPPLHAHPPNLLSNDSIVVAEVTYDYTPLIFDYFMKRAAAGATSGTGVLYADRDDLFEAAQPSGHADAADNTPCPMPTF